MAVQISFLIFATIKL